MKQHDFLLRTTVADWAMNCCLPEEDSMQAEDNPKISSQADSQELILSAVHKIPLSDADCV